MSDKHAKERLIDQVREYISVKEIAAEVGVSVRVVNYWLSGQKNPGKNSVRQLEGIAKEHRGGNVKSDKEEVLVKVKGGKRFDDRVEMRDKKKAKKEEIVEVKPSGKFLEVRKLDKPSIPEAWDYKKSLVAVKAIIYKWTHLSVSVAEELYIAREKLSAVGRPTKENKLGHLSRLSWNDYCNELGVEKRTVNRWLRRFFGKSPLDEPEEKVLPEPEEKEEEKTPRESMLCCLAEHYDSKDAMWSHVKDCDKCPMLTLCRQLGEIIDKDPRFRVKKG